MTSTDATVTDINRHPLAAAMRASDEKVIRSRGPLPAIMLAPTQDTAVRRASTILGSHRQGFTPVPIHDIVTALGAWHLINEPVSA